MTTPAAHDDRPVPVPSTLRWAGWTIAVEGLAGIVVAIVYIVREASGHHEDSISGYGSAAWFGIIGGGVLAGGIALTRGRRWGRGVGLIAQILLIPVAYALLTSSGQPWIGGPLLVVVLATLVMLFAPASLAWLAGEDLPPDA